MPGQYSIALANKRNKGKDYKIGSTPNRVALHVKLTRETHAGSKPGVSYRLDYPLFI